MSLSTFICKSLCVWRFECSSYQWLHPSDITDLCNTQALDFSLAQSLRQIVDFLNRVPSNSDRHSSLLELFL